MKRLGLGLLIAFGLSVLPASAGQVTYPVNYVCDPATITQSLCDALNNTLGLEYSDLFGASAAARIYIQMGQSDDKAVGQNFQFYNTVQYSTYYNALKNTLNSGSDPADARAVASLPPAVNPVDAGYGVTVTSALDNALGLSGASGACLSGSPDCCTPGTLGCCVPGTPGCSGIARCGLTISGAPNPNCYNAIVTISDKVPFYFDEPGSHYTGGYDFFTVVQHETNEVLGTGSCLEGGTLSLNGLCDAGLWGISAADLFRYTAPGVRGFTIGNNQNVTLSGTSAYFSIDRGLTGIASLYNSTNGPDFGDISTVCEHVQDSIGCTDWTSTGHPQGVNLKDDGGTEIAMLDAIGYQLTSEGESLSAAGSLALPEPSSVGLLSVGLGLSGVVLRRRRQRG